MWRERSKKKITRKRVFVCHGEYLFVVGLPAIAAIAASVISAALTGYCCVDA